MQKTIAVVVAEDHNLVRRGIIHLLSRFDEMKVVGEAEDGQGVVDQVAAQEPDVVLMDVSMPILNGLEATRIIKRRAPRTRIIALTAFDDERTIFQILQSGAEGYLLKTTSPEELRQAINTVVQGRTYFSSVVKKVIGATVPGKIHDQKINADLSEDRLTSREREILQLIAEGKSHQQIANLLHISIRTVDTHRNNILKKLDLHDTVGLVLYAVKNGILMIQR